MSKGGVFSSGTFVCRPGEWFQAFSGINTLKCVYPHMCSAFEEYKEVLETVSLKFLEDNLEWVASKLLGVAGALGAEAIELSNWLL